MTSSSITPQDEGIHVIEDDTHWQESWYFNWADKRHDIFGLTRIGLNFHTRKIDGLVVTIQKGKPEFVYPAVNIPFSGDWSEIEVEKGLQARQLEYRVEEPLKQWRLTLKGKDTMDLCWSSFTPPFDYHSSGKDLPPNITGWHFEQSGIVTGHTCFKGTTLEINGTGQRDKSWGVRDWANVEGWNWISAQFGEELSFNIWEGFYKGKCYQNGFVFENGENHPVDHISIDFEWDRRKHVPLITQIKIAYGKKHHLDVSANSLAHFPLIKKGLWIQETHARFSAQSKGNKREGIGVIEHAWHAGKLAILSRLPDLIKTGISVMKR